MQDILLFTQHHLTLTIALLIVLLLLAVLEYVKSKQSAVQLSPILATQMINHDNAVILDIRNAEAYGMGHIINAVSVPLAELEHNQQKLEPFKNRPIILFCAAGTDSPRVATLLVKNGFNTFILAGGMRGWKEADMPLIKNK